MLTIILVIVLLLIIFGGPRTSYWNDFTPLFYILIVVLAIWLVFSLVGRF